MQSDEKSRTPNTKKKTFYARDSKIFLLSRDLRERETKRVTVCGYICIEPVSRQQSNAKGAK